VHKQLLCHASYAQIKHCSSASSLRIRKSFGAIGKFSSSVGLLGREVSVASEPGALARGLRELPRS